MTRLLTEFRAAYGSRRLVFEIYYGFWFIVALALVLTGMAVIL